MILYFHRNPTTFDVFYIGIGTNKHRAYQFTTGRNAHYKSYIAKHGKPIVDIILSDYTREQVLMEEKYFISHFGLSNLTNKSLGGEVGPVGMKLSDEAKKKIGAYWKGRKRKPMTDETKEKLRQANLGKSLPEHVKRLQSERFSGADHPLYGKPRSEETRKKISLSSIGNKHTEETKRKISLNSAAKKGKESHLWGKKQSQDIINKRALSVTGTKRSEETKIQMGISQKAAWEKRKNKSL